MFSELPSCCPPSFTFEKLKENLSPAKYSASTSSLKFVPVVSSRYMKNLEVIASVVI